MAVDSSHKSGTLIGMLQSKAAQLDQPLYTFLEDGEAEKGSVSYRQLDSLARSIAAALQAMNISGGCVLLLYPPGLEFIAAFWGCLYAGVAAVPAYPPRNNKNLARLSSIASDARPACVLTTRNLLASIKEHLFSREEKLTLLPWIATDSLADQSSCWKCPSVSEDTPAFIQYTSGSTGAPKGVIVSHGNVLNNLATIEEKFGATAESVVVLWLPQYHDMGLVGSLLPMYTGFRCYLMAPASFLQKPVRWLRAISKYRATISGGPNFAYDLCSTKIRPEQLCDLDLSSWEVAFNGAEPVRSESLERFIKVFSPYQFRETAFYPCYGMAESTLLITGGSRLESPNVARVSKTELEQNRIKLSDDDNNIRTIVGCGHPRSEQKVVIVDPEALVECPSGRVGEIWTSGKSVAQGYWNQPDKTEQVFRATMRNDDRTQFLRTGDLGFLLDDELFITGRLKDVIIIRGRNHYPQDIELTAEQSHRGLRKGSSAAFSVDAEGEEQLVIVQEVERHLSRADLGEIISAVQNAVLQNHDIRPSAVVLIKTASIPKTSSGKIQRSACRQKHLNGSFDVVRTWRLEQDVRHLEPGENHPKDPQVTQKHEPAADVQAWLVNRIAQYIHASPGDIRVQEPFSRYGLDSVAAIEVSGDLERSLGRKLSPTLVYDYPTIELLSRYLSDKRPVPHTGHAELRAKEVHQEIAVIGLGCRFPGADNPEAFWNLLHGGMDAIREVPADRWDASGCHSPASNAFGAGNRQWGGFLNQVDRFDPDFFGISVREAESMDPQQRLLLEVSWEALENAGRQPDGLAGSRTGVFIGISSYDYGRLHSKEGATTVYAGTGNALSIAANRLSYVFDLRGPSMAIDTACSSSLVAIHQACRSLRLGECVTALAGGVNTILSPDMMNIFSHGRMLAADGRCKTFDVSADGYARGEGCGVVVLRRLEDAVREGDRILAVIRGSAINQDGRSNGLTAPNGPAQQAVIREALADGGVLAADIGYVEAHGTGTALGDPIEFNALTEVLREGRTGQHVCRVGSVKTNIGHLEAAAGIASLIKVVLSLQHEEIPPHLHLKQLNPHISLNDSFFLIPQQAHQWTRVSGQRLAGISSFGFGGTNAHVIVEEAPVQERARSEAERPAHLFTLSAKSENSLRELAGKYEEHLRQNPDVPLGDICFTAAVGRSHFDHRLAVVAESREQLQKQLKAFVSGQGAAEVVQGRSGGKRPKIAFLFTGDETSGTDAGRELYETQPVFRRAIDRCGDLLKERLKRPLAEVLYAGSGVRAVPEEIGIRLLALFATEYALAELWKSWGVEPDAVIGCGSGEYAAACAAGAVALEDTMRLVAELSRRGLPFPADAVSSGPLRDSLSTPGESFTQTAAGIEYAPPRIHIVSNRTGRTIERLRPSDHGNRPELNATLSAGGISTLRELGCTVFMEIGPGNALSKIDKSYQSDPGTEWLAGIGRTRFEWQNMLRGAARLYALGVNMDWYGFDRDYSRYRVALPTYAFERERYWYQQPESEPDNAAPSNPEKKNTLIHPLLHARLRTPMGRGDIAFESRLGSQVPAYLSDYKSFRVNVMPDSAFIEMALAAVAQVVPSGNLALENIIFHQALDLTGSVEKSVQVILSPLGASAFSFKIFSLSAERKESEPQWILHASGDILPGDQSGSLPGAGFFWQRSDSSEISLEAGRHHYENHGIDRSMSFQAIEKAWQTDNSIFSIIRLPETLVLENKNYKLHPVLLDACFLAAGAAWLEQDSESVYFPATVERLQLYDTPTVRMCSRTLVRTGETGNKSVRFADISLFSTDGRLIAVAEEVEFVPRNQSFFTGPQQDLHHKWLYDIAWQREEIQESERPPDFFPGEAEMRGYLSRQFKLLVKERILENHGAAFDSLEYLSILYVLKAFRTMEWTIRGGQIFTTEEKKNELRVVIQQEKMLGRLFEMLEEAGILRKNRSGWEVVSTPQFEDPGEHIKIVRSLYPSAEAELFLLERCGSELAGVLQGTCDPLQLLFPDGNLAALTRLYQDSPGTKLMNTMAQKAVSKALELLPRERTIRILEIGAGTGSTTSYMAPVLPKDRTDYVFTDISPLFSVQAQNKFREYPFIRYKTLDIEKEPSKQGFERHRYDIIIATNVLHATADLRSTMAHVKQLLAPEGMLLLLEGTARERWIDLIFGITDGWWKFQDFDLRPAYPLLSAHGWRKLLEEYGFRQIISITPDQTDLKVLSQQAVMIARADRVDVWSTGSQPGTWIVFADGKGIGKEVERFLATKGESAVLVFSGSDFHTSGKGAYSIDPLNPDHVRTFLGEIVATHGSSLKGVLHLWSLDEPAADASAAFDFERSSERNCAGISLLVRTMSEVDLFESPVVWVITRGARPVGPCVPSIAQARICALAERAMREYPQVKCVSLDMDPAEEANRAEGIFREIYFHNREDRVAFRKGERYVPRLSRYPVRDQDIRQDAALREDATYVIAGGLVELDASIVQWMVQNGARHIVLLNPGGGDTVLTSRLKALARGGIDIATVAADVSDSEELRRVFSDIQKVNPRIRGIMYAAGFRTDNVSFQDDDQWFKDGGRKAQGAWNLHAITGNVPLDFFVTFSSAAAVLGVTAPDGEAALDLFLGVLARYRRTQGLPGTNVSWGPWQELQFLKDRWGKFRSAGVDAIRCRQSLSALDRLLVDGGSHAGVVSVNWAEYMKQFSWTAESRFFSDVAAEAAADGDAQSGNNTAPILPLLKETPQAEWYPLLTEYLRRRIASILRLKANDVEVHEAINGIGLDSLMALELVHQINTEVNVNVPIAKFMEGLTIAGLAAFIVQDLSATSMSAAETSSVDMARHAGGESELPRPAMIQEISTQKAGELLSRVNELSDEEVNALLKTMLNEQETLS